MKRSSVFPVVHALMLLCIGSASAQDIGPAKSFGKNVPEANIDAPSKLGVMVGFPPTPENQVNLRNAMSPRFLRWTLLNPSQVYNTVRVPRGEGLPLPLERGPAFDLDAVRIEHGGAVVAAPDFLRQTGTDALLIMHRGRVVYERYIGDMRPTTLHVLNSCTKSIVGTLVATLAHEGTLDLTAPAARYVPELAASALGSATLNQLLDMRANVSFSDKPHQAGTLQAEVLQAVGVMSRPPGYAGPDGIYELMLSAKPTTIAHGSGPMRYDNGSTETLGWVLGRVTGKRVSELISERIWAPIGAGQDADFLLDSKKFEVAAFGMQSSARDLARFGEMMRNDGRAQGRQVVPAAVVAEIRRGGDRESFAASVSHASRPGGSYHLQWWLNHDADDSYQCNGQFGQRLWISPKSETVIVQLATDPDPSGAREPLRLSAYRAIAAALRR